MQYLAWNDLLAAHFFKPESAGRRVHLSVVSATINALAPTSPDARADFLSAVKLGPPWVTRQGICQKALQSMTGWRQRNLGFPPYVGYLSLFVLAAGIEGEFAPHAYYPRLRTLLDESPALSQFPSFDRMLELWDDLERWATRDKRGELGQFQADIAGGWINVGIPVAQVILSDQERDRLRTIFAEAGFDPGSSPSDEQFAATLVARGHQRLRPRTLHLLQSSGQANSDVRQLLISTALDELREWNGEFRTEDGRPTQIYGTLRICASRVDRVARRATFTLRCKTSHEIPDEGLRLVLAGVDPPLKCLDYVLGWSSELALENNGSLFDASTLDWGSGCSGQANDIGWKFRLPASEVRLFADGSGDSISGLVEISRLPKGTPFYIACNAAAIPYIESWGRAGCRDFVDLQIESGLPADWKLYHSSAAETDAAVRNRFSPLAFNSTLRISFENGVRSVGSQYFTFGLPDLVVDGDVPNLSVFCGSTRLQAGEYGRYVIPEAGIHDGRISIEIRDGDTVLAKRSLFVSDDIPTSGTYQFTGDRFGGRIEAQGCDGFVAGATASSNTPPYRGLFLPLSNGEVVRALIGRAPGQIAWVSEGEQPDGWQPVWAVIMRRRRGHALFCGSGVTESLPAQQAEGDRRSIQDWKQVLWYRRKRIESPEHPALRNLWLSYQEEARKL